ncbi:MAG: prenyltransferase [Acidobacteria bacterium]|nr:prenyltransferase [Acidobacteriota bacterium]
MPRPKAWLMVFRVLPVLVWSGMASVCGVALARMDGVVLDWRSFALVASITALVQGFPAHIINEIYDWKSGADAYQPLGRASGGSKVLKTGLASIPQLWIMFGITFAVILALSALACRFIDIRLLFFICGGIGAALCYTLPPFRLAYRPFAGEWLGGFPGIFLAVTGNYYAQAHTLTSTSVTAATAIGAVYVAIMIFFHLVDFEGDSATGKRTTVVFLGLERSRRYAIACLTLSTLLFIVLAIGNYGFIVLAAESAGLALIFRRTDPGSPAAIVLNGRWITYATVIGAQLFSVTADPRLSVMLLAVAAGYFLHYRFGKIRAAT